MSKTSSSKLFSLIGNSAKDEYDREVGQIVFFVVNPQGSVKEVLVNHGGKFRYYPKSRIKITEAGEVVILSDVKLKTDLLCRRIPLIWRKDQILSDLVKSKKVLPEIYEEFHNQFEETLNSMKAEAKATLDTIEQRINHCKEQLKKLQTVKTQLEIAYAIGEIEDDGYKTSYSNILEGIKQIFNEKKDLESMRAKLSNLLLDEEPVLPTEEESIKEEEKEVQGSPTIQVEEEKEASSEDTISVRLM